MQLDRRPAMIHADHGVRPMAADVVRVRDEGQRVPVDEEVALSADEVLDDVLAALFLSEVVEGLGAAGGRGAVAAAARHTVVTAAAARHRVVARAAARTGAAADEARAAALQGLMAVGKNNDPLLAAGLEDFQGGVGDRRRAEGAGYSRAALLVDDVVAGAAHVDRVMTGETILVDYAARIQGQGIVAAADDDGALAVNVDSIVAVPGDDGAATENVDVNVAAARNADRGAHCFFPRSPQLKPGISLMAMVDRRLAMQKVCQGKNCSESQNVTDLIPLLYFGFMTPSCVLALVWRNARMRALFWIILSNGVASRSPKTPRAPGLRLLRPAAVACLMPSR